MSPVQKFPTQLLELLVDRTLEYRDTRATSTNLSALALDLDVSTLQNALRILGVGSLPPGVEKILLSQWRVECLRRDKESPQQFRIEELPRVLAESLWAVVQARVEAPVNHHRWDRWDR